MSDSEIIILDESQYSSEDNKPTQKVIDITQYPAYVPIEERKREREPLPAGWKQEKKPDGLLYTYDEKGDPRCGAWKTKKRCYCKGIPVPGKNRCRNHGGESPRGILANNYKHGAYSRDLPTQLANRYREHFEDTELLSLRADIALVTATINEAAAGMYSGSAGELWIRARNTHKDLMSAIKKQDEAESTRLFAELGSILNSGYGNTLAEREIHKKQDVKRKLISEERKRLVDMRRMITIEELMMVVGALVDSLKKHVHDSQALSYVSADLRKLLQDRGYADK